MLDGRPMRIPTPNVKHQKVLGTFAWKLGAFVKEHRLGEVFIRPFDVVLSDTDVVEPDVLFISRAREHTLTDENVRGAPA